MHNLLFGDKIRPIVYKILFDVNLLSFDQMLELLLYLLPTEGGKNNLGKLPTKSVL